MPVTVGRRAPFEAASAKYPVPSTLDPTYADANYRYPGWLADDGLEAWTYSQTVLWRTDDQWATTDTVHTFSRGVAGVRQCADGELLVSVQGDASNEGELYKSSGYSRTTGTASSWNLVLTASNNDAYVTGDWNMWVGDGVCAVAEYGVKTPAGSNARKAYVSTDDGDTWSTILDITTDGHHYHGIAYDVVDDLMWVCYGDGPGAPSGIKYTAEWREVSPTWTAVSSAVQPVGIYPMLERIVFGSDDGSNGPYYIDRDDLTTVVSAFDVTQDTTLTHLAGQPFRLGHSPVQPLLLPYGPVDGETGSGHLLGTWDGKRWWRLWTDTESYSGGRLMTAHGPDTDGNIVGYLYLDGRNAAGTRVTWTAPEWRRL
jgi:hypothetical protein